MTGVTLPRATRTRVIGVDPGLSATGYGVIECGTAVTLVEAGVIRLPRSAANNLPLRLELLFNGVGEVIKEFRPETMCLGDVYSQAEYLRTSVRMGPRRGGI